MIRPWRPGDQVDIDRLLEVDADELWVDQFHRLHGADLEGPDWRRTLVATDVHDQVIGCASVAVNTIHPGRLPCAVEVAPPWRRRGVGTELLSAIRELSPRTQPMSTKVRRSNVAAMAFVNSVGDHIYQQCRGVVVDPGDPAVGKWIAAQPTKGCRNLTAVAPADLCAAFVHQYVWVHRSWSPVCDVTALAADIAAEVASFDPEVSAGAYVDDRLAATAFAFPTGDGFEVVAETVNEVEPEGVHLLGGAIAFVLTAAVHYPGCTVRFDGHATDPHLGLVLDTIPHLRTEPVALIECP